MPAILALAATTVAGCTASPTFSGAMVALANSPAASICCLVRVVIAAGACGSLRTDIRPILALGHRSANRQFRRPRRHLPPQSDRAKAHMIEIDASLRRSGRLER